MTASRHSLLPFDSALRVQGLSSDFPDFPDFPDVSGIAERWPAWRDGAPAN